MPLGSLSYVMGSLVLFQLRLGSIGDHDRVIVSWMSSFHESNVRLAYSLSLLVLCVTLFRVNGVMRYVMLSKLKLLLILLLCPLPEANNFTIF